MSGGYLRRNATAKQDQIVVDVMVAIFDNLFNDKDELPGQMSIYDYL